VEGKSKTNLDKLTGRTRTNKIVNFTVRAGTAAKLKLNTSADGDEIFQKEIGSEVSNAGKGYLTGKIVPVKIVRSGLYSLDGQVIN